MKKNIIICLIIAFVMSSCDDSTKYPEPNLIPFEKQEVISSRDFRLIESSGKTINIYANKEKITFIHYWNTTEETTTEDLKIIEKLYNDYKLKIEFYFITDDTQANVRNYIKDNGFLFPTYFIGSSPPRPLVFNKTSKTYLLSKTGRIVIDQEGIANWDSKKVRKTIDELIKL